MSQTSQVGEALNLPVHGSSVQPEVVSPNFSVVSLVRNSGTAIAGGLVSQFLKLLVVVYVAREFGAAEFGSFSFASSVNAFLYIVAQFGLPTIGTREVAQTGRLDPRLLKAVTQARILLATSGAAVALIILSLSRWVNADEFWLVAGFGLSNLALSWFGDWAFQGMGKLYGWAALNICWQALWLIFTILGVRIYSSVRVVSFAYAAAAALAGWIGWLWLRSLSRPSDEHPSAAVYSLRSVMKSGTQVGAGAFLSIALVWTDIIFVRLLKGPQSAGIYAAGNRASLALSMLAGFYMQGAFPLLTRVALEGRAQFQRCFQQTYNNMTMLFVPGSVWAWFYAPEILRFLYKRNEYLSAVPVFQLFILVFLLTMVGIVLYGLGVLLAVGEDRTYRKMLVAACVSFLLICPPLTRGWGIEGAAVAALLAQIVLTVLFEIKVRRFVTPNHKEAFLIPALAGLLAAVAGQALHLPLFGEAALVLAAYALLFVQRIRSQGWASLMGR